jgi:hypothetical protein
MVCSTPWYRLRSLAPRRPRHPISPAAIWALEAAYLLCAGEEGNAIAVKLLRLALKEIERFN